MDDGVGNLATDSIESGCSRSTADARLNMVYVCPSVRQGYHLSSMGGWKLGLRAGWSGAAARRSRSAITRGGMGGLWVRDSRIPASVVANFRIAACNFRSRFGPAMRTQKRDRLAGLLLFPFRKVYWKHNGNRSVEGFAGPPGGPNFGAAFGTSLHQPFYPCHSVSPPRPLHTLYQIGIHRCASPARARGRPHHHPFAFPSPSTHLSTPSTPRSAPTTEPHCPTLLLPFMIVCNHIILRTHPCFTSLPRIFPCHAISHGRCVNTIL